MMSGQLLQGMLSEPDNRLGRLLTAGTTNRDIVEELYLAALCRPPTEIESAAAAALVRKSQKVSLFRGRRKR